jgi:hypothetical protein
MSEFGRFDELDEKIVKNVKKKTKRKLKKGVKRLNGWTLFFCIVALIAGLAAGIGAYELLCMNDEFELNGRKEYYVELRAGTFEYIDAGATVIEFGRDISDEVRIETNMTDLGGGRYEADASISGIYYIKYTVDSVKYGEVCRIRTFTVGGES